MGKNNDLERIHPVVKLVETTYKKGIRMAKKAFKTFLTE